VPTPDSKSGANFALMGLDRGSPIRCTGAALSLPSMQ
jgi:hypothetical protein